MWLNFNNLSGYVPDSICNLNLLNWSPYGFNGEDSYLNNNKLCPPYPDCIQEEIGEQDISECEEIQLGDINFDGLINVQDIVQIINIILSSEYNDLADMNFDDIVNILDVIQLVNLILN